MKLFMPTCLPWISQDRCALIFGACLPGKPKGFDGSEVERYFREGKIKEVTDYCETDVVGTYQLWLRYELFRGTLNRNAFEASEHNLAVFINARMGTYQPGAR